MIRMCGSVRGSHNQFYQFAPVPRQLPIVVFIDDGRKQGSCKAEMDFLEKKCPPKKRATRRAAAPRVLEVKRLARKTSAPRLMSWVTNADRDIGT